MKVFISWSGERSQLLAQALNEWLPLVLHYVQPWMSQAEIAAGERWSPAVATELESTNFGILCITPENLNNPWVLFEAGALAKSLQGSKVIPLLYHLDFSEIAGPLSQFQAKKFEKAGVQEVVQSINQSCTSPVADEIFNQLFEALYPALDSKLNAIPAHATETHRRPQQEVMEELVTGVRALDLRFRDLERVYEEQVSRSRRRRIPFHPGMIEEVMFLLTEETSDTSTALLMLAGFIRDDFPWLYELFLDTARELRDTDPKTARRAIERLRRAIRATGRRPYIMNYGDKESHMLAVELPHMLEHALHRFEDRLMLEYKQTTADSSDDKPKEQKSETDEKAGLKVKARVVKNQ